MKSQVQSHLDTIADGIQLMWGFLFVFYFLGIIHQSIIIVIVHPIIVTLLVLLLEYCHVNQSSH